ncbi:MAG: CoA transferase [Pseudomonadota bacterium]
MSGPLEGVRVIDLSRLVAGNMLSVVLADFGADVIKIERPGHGDDLRHWQEAGVEIYWKVYSRNKRSLTLDLKDEAAVENLLHLAASAQVLIENFLPGKLEGMGLGPDVLHARNPNLIVVRVTGWGQTSDYRDRPGFGTLVEAMSGYAHLNGYPDKPPALPPLATADMIAGLYGAFGVMAALRAVEIQGQSGQVIDLSLFEGIFSFVAAEALKHRLTGRVSERAGNQSSHTAPRNVYETADGRYIALSGSMQAMFERIARTIGRGELVEDPRFLTNSDRVANRDTLDQIVGDFIAGRDQSEVMALFDANGVTAAPIATVADLMNHPYARSREIFAEIGDRDMGHAPLAAPVPRLTGTPGSIRRQAPSLGEDNEVILAEIAAIKRQDAGGEP